jgi:sec-independent protein translocase protein TatA
MGSMSIWHWLIVLAVVLILFGGGGKISKLMGDFGKGLKSFKKGLSDEEQQTPPAPPPTALNADPSATAPNAASTAAVSPQAPRPTGDQPARG